MTKHKSGSTSFVLGLLLAYGNDDNTASDWEVKGKRIRSTGWRYKQIQVSGKTPKG